MLATGLLEGTANSQAYRSHSLKASLLIWCARAGFDKETGAVEDWHLHPCFFLLCDPWTPPAGYGKATLKTLRNGYAWELSHCVQFGVNVNVLLKL